MSVQNIHGYEEIVHLCEKEPMLLDSVMLRKCDSFVEWYGMIRTDDHVPVLTDAFCDVFRNLYINIHSMQK